MRYAELEPEGTFDELLPSDKSVKDRLKEIGGDINMLVKKLDFEPLEMRNLHDVQFEGWTWMTQSGRLHWKKYYTRLMGDLISFYKSPTDDKCKAQFIVNYFHLSNVTTDDTLTGKQISEGLFCKKRIKIITPGLMIDLSFENDEQGMKWNEVLNQLIQLKFKMDEIKEKETARKELEPLLKSQQDLIFEKYATIMKALAESGFWVTKEKKIREGYCYLKRQNKPSKKLYVVLYRDFVYFFRPADRVSVTERPYYLINIKFISACDVDKDKCFFISTPLKKFVLRTKHETAQQEWIEKIRNAVEKKGTRIAPRIKRVKKVEDHGYVYSKPINKYLSVIETFDDGKHKVHKLNKNGNSTIGRSHSNDVVLTADKFISRSHCKIVIENNVPYVMDLGQGKGGTRLNGKKVEKAPLKPGDLIGMGKSDIVFQVKNGISIFSASKPITKESDESHSRSHSFSDSGIGLEDL